MYRKNIRKAFLNELQPQSSYPVNCIFYLAYDKQNSNGLTQIEHRLNVP